MYSSFHIHSGSGARGAAFVVLVLFLSGCPNPARAGRYTITFDAQGGSPVESLAGEEGAEIPKPDNPHQAGLVFTGWYTEPVRGALYVWPHILDRDVVMYGQWRDEAQPAPTLRNVTYLSGTDRGTPPASPTVDEGTTILLPGQEAMIAPDGTVFAGWESGGRVYQAGEAYTVAGNVIFTARWEALAIPEQTPLAESLAWISANAWDGGAYTIALENDEALEPQLLSYGGKAVSITLTGGEEERRLSLGSPGNLFIVDSNVRLTLGGNITLQGLSGNTDSLVRVNSGGALIMEEGATIAGNSASIIGGGVFVMGEFLMNGGIIINNNAGNGGGGVAVLGSFTMNGGTIEANSAASSFGGGVFVFFYGSFAMNGGTIQANSADNAGGGVYANGSFEMSGGEIARNIVYNGGGGGVYLSNASFALSGGRITGNVVYNSGGGGGVYLSNASFALRGGEVSANTAETGGGVYVNGGSFALSAGEVSGNNAVNDGGGVYLNSGSFALSAGEVSGNRATLAGGVYVAGGSFELSGGAVSRNSGGDFGAGGVYVAGGSFAMRGGGIEENTSHTDGAGVYVAGGSFELSGGGIAGNTASADGAGVYVAGGSFAMRGGEIAGNTASQAGGGVFVNTGGAFAKTGGGVIYGSDAEAALRNTGGDDRAVYVVQGPNTRTLTAGADVDLDSAASGPPWD
jgi:hypothetical protein